MRHYGLCPQCGHWSIEHLKSYSHCWECFYSPDLNKEISYWQKIESKPISKQNKYNSSSAAYLNPKPYQISRVF